METISRVLAKAMLVCFALLFGLALLLGACRPAHLSYPAAFAAAVAVAALYAVWQKRPRKRASLWERLGERRTAVVLLVFCFLVNLDWVLAFRLEPTVDYATFWNTAVELATGENVMNHSYVALFPHILGYSSFLSLMLRLFGTGELVAPVVNMCLTTLSGYFLFRLTLRWCGLNSAAFVLLFWSVFPSKTLYNAMVLSEPWYTCLLLAALWLCAGVEAKRPAWWKTALLGILAGLLLRLVNAARPIALVPILALLIWVLLLRRDRERGTGRRWMCFLALLLAVYALTGPLWTRYERDVLGEEPASTPGYSVCVGFNMESLGSYSVLDMNLLEYYRFGVQYADAESAQRDMLELAKVRLRDPQMDLPQLMIFKLRTLLGNDEGGVYYSSAGLSDLAYRLLAPVSNVCYYVLGILALWGSWRLFRSGERRTALLAPLFVIGLTLAQLVVEVAARYHYSVIPMLLLLAAFSYNKPTRPKPDV